MKPEYTKDKDGNPIKIEKIDINVVLDQLKKEREAVVTTLADYDSEQVTLEERKANSNIALLDLDAQIAKITEDFKSDISASAEVSEQNIT